MKTTLVIADPVMERLRTEAGRRGLSMSALVEMAIRRLLDEKPRPAADLPPLPTFKGRLLVNVADRDALSHAMEGDDECLP